MISMFEDSECKLLKIIGLIEEIYGDKLHKKRQQSIAYAAMGVLASNSLFLHRIAEGLVKTRGGKKKHATKQIDRLLSNKQDLRKTPISSLDLVFNSVI